MNRIKGELVKLARDLRRISQAELARQTGISAAVLCRIERNESTAQDRQLEQIAVVLELPIEFFASQCPASGAVGEVHFRRKSSALAGARRSAVAELNIASYVADYVHEQLGIPDPDLCMRSRRLHEFNGSTDLAAHTIRREWQLPPGPITNLTRIAESAGVYVFSFDLGEDIVGLSHWPRDRQPVVCLNSSMPGDRLRWTLAHELGHLALHSRGGDAREMEREADGFAAALLLPRDDVFESLSGVSIARLRDLKHEWGVSMQALIRRASDLGRLTEYQQTALFKSFSKRGWRTREPEPIPAEESRMAQRRFQVLASAVGGDDAIALQLGLDLRVLRRITESPEGRARGHLRLLDGGTGKAEEASGGESRLEL